MKTLFACLLIGLSGSAFAAEDATFKNLGFSDDGKTYAFVEHGTGDGSGFPYAHVSVIDVAQNKLLARKDVSIEKEGATEKQAVAQALAAVQLERFGIRAGALPGTTLLYRAPTDRSRYTDVQFTLEEGRFMPVYELKLETKSLAGPGTEEWCSSMGGPLGFKLTLQGASEGNSLSRVLQDDQRVPKSRFCPLSYGVSRVIRQGKSLVVILSYSEVGFEGPDSRFLAVTTAAI